MFHLFQILNLELNVVITRHCCRTIPVQGTPSSMLSADWASPRLVLHPRTMRLKTTRKFLIVQKLSERRAILSRREPKSFSLFEMVKDRFFIMNTWHLELIYKQTNQIYFYTAQKSKLS
jgi:hypothetical protein